MAGVFNPSAAIIVITFKQKHKTTIIITSPRLSVSRLIPLMRPKSPSIKRFTPRQIQQSNQNDYFRRCWFLLRVQRNDGLCGSCSQSLCWHDALSSRAAASLSHSLCGAPQHMLLSPNVVAQCMTVSGVNWNRKTAAGLNLKSNF